jgi:genome maintenance exonuclease 1
MFAPKFDYQSIPRTTVNGRRYYATPDGKRLPSVTTILEATKSEESKQGLENWRNNVGHARAQAITTEAANRGTRMHAYLEHYVKTGNTKPRPSNPYAWSSHAMAQVVIDSGLCNVSEIWGVEVPLYFPSIYAGTTDSVGIHAGDEAIIDYKQTNKEKKLEWIDDYFLQTVFYGIAHNEVYNTQIRKGVIMMCVKPELDSNYNITTPPKYQEFIIKGSDWDRYETAMWNKLEQYFLMTA